MINVKIIVPVDNYDEVEHYYRNSLSFLFRDGLLFLPVNNSDVALQLMVIDEESKTNSPPRRFFPIFGYRIERNFLSYCKKIYSNGALVEMACATPGGYYALVSDPAGNQFEIECSSFEEEYPIADLTELPFFYSY